MNIFSKEFGTAMLMLLIVFAAVLAVCGIATLIAKIMKKDVTVLTKILASVFAVVFLGTTIFNIVQMVPVLKADKSMIGLFVGTKLVEVAIGLMLIIMMIETTKKNWLSLVLSILPVAYSIYTLVMNFSSVGALTEKSDKVDAYVGYIGNVVVYVAVLVFCFLKTVGVIKNRKKAILIGMIPAILAAICFTVRFAFNVQLYTDSLVVTTVFDALGRALMVIWCYAMAAKSGNVAVAENAAPQPVPQPQPMPQPAFQNTQPAFQAQQPVPGFQPQQPAHPVQPVVDNAPKFDPVTGQPMQPSHPTEELAN